MPSCASNSNQKLGVSETTFLDEEFEIKHLHVAVVRLRPRLSSVMADERRVGHAQVGGVSIDEGMPVGQGSKPPGQFDQVLV